jgi:hypothetical protein
MIDRDALERAFLLSRQAYELMKWIGDAVANRTVAFDRAHGTMSMPAAARDWFEHNYDCLPERARPPREDLAAFANLVSTYLDTSFDLKPAGQQRLESHCGCYCELCVALVDASSLVPKRLGRGDKEHAVKLIRAMLRDRAAARGKPLDDATLTRLASDNALREPLAMTAWSIELLRRLDGYVAGPAVLVLWRMFAWSPLGSPVPNFELRLDDLLAADAAVDAAIDAELARALA